jgi:hypothetical protein
MLSIYSIIIIINIILGVTPIIKNPKEKTNITFAFLSLSISFWILCNYMYHNHSNILLWGRITFIGSGAIPYFLLLFSSNYPTKKIINLSKIKISLLSTPLITIIIFSQTKLFFSGLDSRGIPLVNSIGQALFTIYFSLYLLSFFIISIKQVKKNIGLDKQKAKIFLSGVIIAIITAALTNLILPQLGYLKFYKLGPLFASIFTAIASYSILKYRFMDISPIISKSSAWIISIIISITAFITSIWVYESYVTLISSKKIITWSVLYWSFFSSILPSLRLRLQSTADKLFLKGKYNYKKVLIKLTNQFASCNNIKDLTKILETNFKEDIEVYPINILIPENFEETKETSKTLKLLKPATESETTIQAPYQKLEPENIILKHLNKNPNVLLSKDAEPALKEELKKWNAKAIVPCLENNELLCLLILGDKMSQDALSDDDVDLFTTISTQIPTVLDRIKQARVSAEMDVARHIQTEILPKDPQIPGLDLACFMNPADEVGGDYYDIFKVSDYSWIIMGDVAGHGVGSGLVMFMAQSIITSLVHANPTISPRELNYQANVILSQNLQRLSDQRPMTIVTLCTKNGREFTISGNHDNIFIYRAKNNEVESKSINHIPFGIGMIGDMELELFEQETLTLEKDDLLFLATDGIVEAPKNGDYKTEQFGEERLQDFILKYAKEPTDKIKTNLVSIVDKYANHVYHDDITFIVARAV